MGGRPRRLSGQPKRSVVDATDRFSSTILSRFLTPFS